jgi:nucleotide-binding universal stress UspA family protein
LRSLGVNYQVHVRFAQTPVEGILEEVKAGDYDLVVIGSQGFGLRSLLKYNKVMLQVLADVDRPVLVVPTDKV